MEKIKCIAGCGIIAAALFGVYAYGQIRSTATITDVYKLRMRIYTPRIYNNSLSLGYRKYNPDVLLGELWVTYPSDGSGGATLSVTNLYNKSYKINGNYVTYQSYIDEDSMYPRVHCIGNNKTKKFDKASIAFAMVCDPSYNIGAVEEDNSLYITLGGKGKLSSHKRKGSEVISYMRGYLAGILGCGCSEYGHISPTRIMGVNGPMQDVVVDVASVWGIWTAKYERSFIRE